MKKISLLTVTGVFALLLSLFAVPALAAESEIEAVAASEEYVLEPGLYYMDYSPWVYFDGDFIDFDFEFYSYYNGEVKSYVGMSFWTLDSYYFLNYLDGQGGSDLAYSNNRDYTGWDDYWIPGVSWNSLDIPVNEDSRSIYIEKKQSVSAETYNFLTGNSTLEKNIIKAGTYQLIKSPDVYCAYDSDLGPFEFDFEYLGQSFASLSIRRGSFNNNKGIGLYFHSPGSTYGSLKYIRYFDSNGVTLLYDDEWVWDDQLIYVNNDQLVDSFLYTWIKENTVTPEEFDFYYDSSTSTYFVSGIGSYSKTNVVIPSTYRGKAVSGVYDNAFKDNKDITSVSFEGENKLINDNAFRGCSSLSYVEFSAVSYIGVGAFCDCTSITEADLTSTVFGSNSFQGCKSLAKVTLSDTIQRLPSYAFANTAITSLDLPLSLNEIDNGCFSDCASLASVNYAGDIEQKGLIDIGSSNEALQNAKWNYKYALYRFYKYNGTAIEELSLRVLSPSTVSLNFGTLPFTVTVSDGQSVSYTGDDNFVGLSFAVEGDITYLEEPYVFAGTELPKVSVYLYDENLDFLYSSSDDAYYVSGIGRYKKPNVIIPDTYNGKRVIGIYEYAFSNVTTITSVDLPAYCSVIQSFAFYGCTNLQTINFEDMLSGSTLGRAAFSKCTSLVSGDLTSIDYIGRETFRYCSSLSSVTFSNSLVSFGEYSFSESGLVDVVIPGSLSVITGGCFEKCANLKSLYLPNISKVDIYAFGDCNALASVFFEGDYLQAAEIVEKSGNDKLLSADWTYEYVYYYFYDYKGTELPELTLRAYYKDYVTINFDKTPLTVTHGYQTLTYSGIDYQIAGFANVAQGAVTYVDGTYTVKGSTNAREDFYFYADILDFVYSNTHGGYLVAGIGYYESEDIVVPAEYKGLSVVGIKDRAFLNDTTIRKVILPIGFKYIGESAFRGCSGLISVNFEAMLEGELNNSAFSGCKALYNANLINIKKIGNSAFYDCLALSDVTFSNTLSSIGSYAFHCCFALKSVTLPDTIKTIPQYCFYNTRLEHLELGQVTTIEQYAFSHATTLKTVFYRGDYKQAEKIYVAGNNEPLDSAVWSYQYVLYNFYDYKGRTLEGLSLRVMYNDVVTLHFDEEPFRVCVNGARSYTESGKFVGFSDRKLGDVFDVTGVYTFEGLSENYIDLYLANEGYRNDIILDEFHNSSSGFIDKSDQLQNDLGSLQKPDVENVTGSLDNVLNEDLSNNVAEFSEPLGSIFESDIVMVMLVIGLTMALSAFVLFGKAK